MGPFYFYNYYYIVLIIQALCVFHSIRKGNQQKWIYIIVFLPLIGSIAYIFTEVVRKNDIENLQTGVVNTVNPGGKIKKLEKNFQFTNTFANRVALADAYLLQNLNEKVIELMEPALTGIFYDNEDGVRLVVHANYNLGNYHEVATYASRIAKSMTFSKGITNLYYAFALEKMGDVQKAEKEFEAMNHRYSNFEQRYHYGCFLIRHNRKNDAINIFQDITDEADKMTRKEKRNDIAWIGKAQQELVNLMTGGIGIGSQIFFFSCSLN